MSVEFTVCCDRCGTIGGASKRKASIIRAELKAQGWSVAREGGFDYCPDCYTATRAEGT